MYHHRGVGKKNRKATLYMTTGQNTEFLRYLIQAVLATRSIVAAKGPRMAYGLIIIVIAVVTLCR